MASFVAKCYVDLSSPLNYLRSSFVMDSKDGNKLKLGILYWPRSYKLKIIWYLLLILHDNFVYDER